jgi:hypothetical protein
MSGLLQMIRKCLIEEVAEADEKGTAVWESLK